MEEPIVKLSRQFFDDLSDRFPSRTTTEVLGFPPELVAADGPLALLRQKLALEPSIAGSKLTQQE